jgi:hypothetical protein
MKILRPVRILAGCAALSGICFGQTGPANDATGWIAQGDADEQNIHTQAALECYLQAEKITPNDSDVLYRMAREYAELMPDQNSEAEKQRLGETALGYAQRAVAGDPHNAHAQLALAICYGRLAKFQDDRTKIDYSRKIKENAEEALRLDPKLDYADFVLGDWNYEMANLNPVLRWLAEIIYGQLPDASNAMAAAYFQHAIALAPQRVAHHIELGRTYAAMGKPDLARTEIERGLALPILEKDDETMKQRGRDVLAALGQPKAAGPTSHR